MTKEFPSIILEKGPILELSGTIQVYQQVTGDLNGLLTNWQSTNIACLEMSSMAEISLSGRHFQRGIALRSVVNMLTIKLKIKMRELLTLVHRVTVLMTMGESTQSNLVTSTSGY